MQGDEANISAVEERYKEAKNAVARVKGKAYENLYKRLDSKEGENDIYRIAKARERREMDLRSVRFIKDEDGRSIINKDAIWRRWKEYLSALFNGQRNKVVGLNEAWRYLEGEGCFRRRIIGLHQGSAISLYLFALILDKLSRGIQESIPWCLIFADDIVLVLETPEGLNERLKKWREMVEDKGLRVSKEKTKYLRCDFNWNENDQNKEAEIRIGEPILETNESFRYLGSVIHE
ncbi:retrovirus-related pol polyprotein LINE-1 [Tanacetum coccineum]